MSNESNEIYRFVNGRCPEHEQETVIRVTFSETEEIGLDGSQQYKKGKHLCGLADAKGCKDPDQCPIYVYAEALS